MRKVLIILVALAMFFIAAPAFAQDEYDFEMGTWSIGMGGGFSDSTDVGPFVLSGKYWDAQWEIGADVYSSFESESQDYDQIGMAWLAYRYDLSVEEASATYAGIGAAGIFQESEGWSSQFGPVGVVGWDSDIWGLELKWAYFDPSVISAVAYYHFNEE